MAEIHQMAQCVAGATHILGKQSSPFRDAAKKRRQEYFTIHQTCRLDVAHPSNYTSLTIRHCSEPALAPSHCSWRRFSTPMPATTRTSQHREFCV
jgi:hypothetical protein